MAKNNLKFKPAIDTWNARESNACDIPVKLLALKQGEKIIVQFATHIRVIRGTIAVNGGTLSSNNSRGYTRIVQPPWLAALEIQPISYNNFNESSYLGHSSIKDFLKKHSNGTYPVVLSFCDTHTVFGDISVEDSVIRSYQYDRPIVSISDTWVDAAKCISTDAIRHHVNDIDMMSNNRCLNDIDNRCLNDTHGGGVPVVLITGAKNVGKSSFCRFLINYLLSTLQNIHTHDTHTHDTHTHDIPVVGFLDTDIGQPELTPPGLISTHMIDGPLLSSPHSQMRVGSTPIASYFVASVTPSNDPILFLHCVQAAYASFKNYINKYHKNKCIPLIVNTHGWVTGLGLELVDAIGAIVGATHHVQVGCELVSLSLSSSSCGAIDTLLVESGCTPLPWLDRPLPRLLVGSGRHNLTHKDPTNKDSPITSNDRNKSPQMASIHKKAITHTHSPVAKDLRWLRLCAWFEPLFELALHFPSVSLDSIFGGTLRHLHNNLHSNLHNNKHADIDTHSKREKDTHTHTHTHTQSGKINDAS
eukprot:GHVR01062607.1.p1 GENE.GHVR01062607.1~~GHVR01062607.1.p1  ORF type:complete len:530 (-),score=171.10 GHVR01062607.1:192-1781(-)